jgi:hypothetical protein
VNRKPKHISQPRKKPGRRASQSQGGRIESQKMVPDGRTMNELIALLQLENEMDLVIETGIVNGHPGPEADRELLQVDAVVASRDLPVLSTSIGTYLALLGAEAADAKAQL